MEITTVERLEERMKDPFFHHHILADQIIALRAMFVYVELHPNERVPSSYYYKAGLAPPAEIVYRLRRVSKSIVPRNRNKVISTPLGNLKKTITDRDYTSIQDTDREEHARQVIKRSFSRIGILPNDTDDEIRSKVLGFFKKREETYKAWNGGKKKEEHDTNEGLSTITAPTVSNQDYTIRALAVLIKKFGWFRRS